MTAHADLIHSFYTAFGKADAASMIQCYHDEIQFEDPVFGKLYGDEAKKMWRMLVRPGIKITFSNVVADKNTGSANWTAEYVFGKSQRQVTNHIHAQFQFKDGKIIAHTDDFDFWKWSRQALGATGLILGWTPWLRKKLQSSVRIRLSDFDKH